MLKCFFLLLGTKDRICDKSIQYIIGLLVDSADCGDVPEDDRMTSAFARNFIHTDLK